MASCCNNPRLHVAWSQPTRGGACVVVRVAPCAINPARCCDILSSVSSFTSGPTNNALCGGCSAADEAAIGGVGWGLSTGCMRQQASGTCKNFLLEAGPFSRAERCGNATVDGKQTCCSRLERAEVVAAAPHLATAAPTSPAHAQTGHMATTYVCELLCTRHF